MCIRDSFDGVSVFYAPGGRVGRVDPQSGGVKFPEQGVFFVLRMAAPSGVIGYELQGIFRCV